MLCGVFKENNHKLHWSFKRNSFSVTFNREVQHLLKPDILKNHQLIIWSIDFVSLTMKKTPHWKYHCSHVCIVLVCYPKFQSYAITKQGLVSFSDGPTSTMNRMWQEQQQHASIRSCSTLCHVPPLPLFGINIVSLKHLIHSFVPVSRWSGRACTLSKPCSGTPKWNACIKNCNLLHRRRKNFAWGSTWML